MNTVFRRCVLTALCFLLTFSLSAMSGSRPAPGHKFRSSSTSGKFRKDTTPPVRKFQPAQSGGRIAAGPAGFSRKKKSQKSSANSPNTRTVTVRRQPEQPASRQEPVKKETEESVRTQPVRKASEFRPDRHRTVQKHERGTANSHSDSPVPAQKQEAQSASSAQGKRIVEKKSRSGR